MNGWNLFLFMTSALLLLYTCSLKTDTYGFFICGGSRLTPLTVYTGIKQRMTI